MILAGSLVLLIVVYVLLHQLIFASSARGFNFWLTNHLCYLEFLFRRTFGIIVIKVITIGWYLRQHR